jgi:hypothetical protein
MDPSENPAPSSGADSDYVLETKFSPGCTTDVNTNLMTDSRYQ